MHNSPIKPADSSVKRRAAQFKYLLSQKGKLPAGPAPLGKRERINPMLWGTVGYLFLFIFRPFEYWEWLGEWRIERVYVICLLVALSLWKGNRYVHHSITTAFIGFFLVISLSIFVAYRPEEAVWETEEYMKLMVLYFVIIMTVRTKNELKFLVIAFLMIMGIYVGKSMWEFFVHGRHEYRMGIPRLIGIDKTYSDPNTFAATIVYSLPLGWALWKSESSKWIRKGLIFYGAMSLAAVMLTGSRSGFVTLALFGILTWIRGQKKILGLMALIILAAFSWQLLPADLKLRYLSTYDKSINESATESAQGRIEGLKNGLKLWIKSPIFGWGAGNFRYAVEKIGVYNRMQSHNLYGQLAAELGIVGIIAFFAICFLIYRTQRRILKTSSSLKKLWPDEDFLFIREISGACLNIMLLLLFNGNFGHNLYRYTWLVIGAILVRGQILISKRPDGSVAGLPTPKTPRIK